MVNLLEGLIVEIRRHVRLYQDREIMMDLTEVVVVKMESVGTGPEHFGCRISKTYQLVY